MEPVPEPEDMAEAVLEPEDMAEALKARPRDEPMMADEPTSPGVAPGRRPGWCPPTRPGVLVWLVPTLATCAVLPAFLLDTRLPAFLLDTRLGAN